MFCAVVVFFFKQKTAYEMRISDWSSDVCSSDLEEEDHGNDQRSQPGVEDEGQREDRGRDQGAETEQREDARATEETGTDARVLRLRLHLDLRQLELVPDQPAGVLGEPLQQLRGARFNVEIGRAHV